MLLLAVGCPVMTLLVFASGAKSIECILRRILVIRVDTKPLILKKAGEETIWNV